MVLEAGKSTVTVPAGSGSGRTVFPVSSQGRGREDVGERKRLPQASSYKGTVQP